MNEHPFRLEGKVALVTGAARGTGEAIARHFVAAGARVVLSDVLDELGEKVAAELGEAARYRRLDVTSEADWNATLEDIDAHEGRFDVLVNNAAILVLQPLEATSQADFERVLRVNTVGPFLGTRAALSRLRAAASETGDAAIVNVGSTDSLSGTTTTGAYTASKFGLVGLTKVTALENGMYGVRANVLCPRAGSAEMHADAFGVASPPSIASGTDAPSFDAAFGPMGRRGLPDDVAPAAVFLASPEARFINGTELLIDGGKYAGEFVDVPGRFRAAPPEK